MRLLTIVSFLLLACDSATAWGQYSLYARPESIPFAASDPVYGAGLDSTGKPYPQGTEIAQGMPAGPTARQFPYSTAAVGMAPAAQAGFVPRGPAWQPYPRQPSACPPPYPRLADARQTAATPAAQPMPPMAPTPAGPGPVAPVPNGPLAPIPEGNAGLNGSWISPSAGCCGDDYGFGCGGCDPCCAEGPWFVSAVALMMSRSNGSGHVLSVNADHVESTLLDTSDEMPWRAGGEIRLGRSFCCNRWAVEGVYSTLAEFEDPQAAATSDAFGPVPAWCSTFNDAAGSEGTDRVTIGGIPALQFFDSVPQAHRVERSSDFQNAEINVLCRAFPPGTMPCDLSFVVGARFFRFDDRLLFESRPTIDVNGALLPGYAYFRDDLTNTLWGAQAGFDSGFSVFPRLRFFFAPKIGIYSNHIEAAYDVAGQVGAGPLQPAVSNTPGNPNFPVNSSRNTLATLSQADVGLDWNFARNWTARIGYRLIAVTGVALAEDQVPVYLSDTPGLVDVNRHSSLLIHGAFAGLGYRF